MRAFLTGLRFRLILLVMVSVCPAFALLSLEMYVNARKDIETDLRRLVNIVSTNHDRLMESAQHLVSSLALFPSVIQLNCSACKPSFEALLQRNPKYSAFAIVSTDGNPVCSFSRSEGGFRVSEQICRKAIETRSFVSGGYEFDHGTGRTCIPLACPMTDEFGKITHVLYSNLDISWFMKQMEVFGVPPGCAVAILNTEGRVEAGYPDRDTWITKFSPPPQVLKNIINKEVLSETWGSDGIERVYAFRRLGFREHIGYLCIGIASKQVFGTLNQASKRNLFIFLGLTLVVGTASWALGRFFVLDPLNQVVLVTGQIGSGDLSARSNLKSNIGELAVIGDAVNQMVESLQKREAESAAVLGQLQKNESLFRAVLESSVDSIAICDRNYDCLFANRGTLARLEMPTDNLKTGNIQSGLSNNPDLMNLWTDRIDKVFDSPQILRVKDKIVIDEKIVVSESTISPVKDAGGNTFAVAIVYRDVTKHKQAERSLREAYKLHGLMLSASPMGILAFGMDGECIWNNRASSAIIGAPDKKRVSLDNLRESKSWKNSGLLEDAEAVFADGLPRRREIHEKSRFGKEMHVDCTLSRFTWFDEPHILLVMNDISQRIKIEEDLRASEAKYRALVEQVPATIYVSTRDQEAATFYISPQVEKIFGVSAEEWSKHPQLWGELLHPLDRDRVLGELIDCQTSGKAFCCEYRMLSGFGNVVWVRDQAALMEISPGRFCLQGIVLDITEQKRMEEELITKAARDQLLADISDSFYKNHNENEVFGYIMQRATELIGDGCVILLKNEAEEWQRTAPLCHSDDENLSALKDLLSTIPNRGITEILANVLRTGEKFVMNAKNTEDFYGFFPEMYRPYLERFQLGSILIAPVRSESEVIGTFSMWRKRGRPYTPEDQTIVQHIADRVGLAVANSRLFRQLQQLNLELERRVQDRTAQLVSANNELEAFSYSVSHDLRAPLRGIEGLSRIISERYSDGLDPKGKEYFKLAISEAQRMSRLIDDLLKLSKLGRVEMDRKKVDLSAVASEILQSLTKSEPNRKTEIVLEPDLWVYGDEGLLRIAMENLINNAWKFTRHKEIARLHIGKTGLRDETTFFIKDNGAGFNMEYASNLFKAFQRLHTSREFPGTGIGLAIVQRIINRHNGKVWAESAEDQGATFFLSIP